MTKIIIDCKPFTFSQLFTRTKVKVGNHSNQSQTVNSFPCEIGLGFPHLKTLKSRDDLSCKPVLLDIIEPHLWLYSLNAFNYHFYTSDGFLYLKASRIVNRGIKLCEITF